MSDCSHHVIADPPPGKTLRVCLECASRLIECDGCDAKLTAGPHVLGSGWIEEGQIENGIELRWSWCPTCWARRRAA